MRALLAAVGAIAVVAVGCGDDGATPPVPDGPLVVYERGGGIAGVAERLVVRTDGTAMLTVGVVDPRRRELELSQGELERLAGELGAADLGAVEPADPNACADCFVEAVTYAGETATLQAELEAPPESVTDALAHLREIVASG